METCICENADGVSIIGVIPDDEQRLHSRTIKVQEGQVGRLESILRKLCPAGYEFFVGSDTVVLVSSYAKIIGFENFMDKGLEQEMQRIIEGGESGSPLTLEELRFLSEI